MMETVFSHLKDNKFLMEKMSEKLYELAQSLKVNHKINLKNMDLFNVITEGLNKLQLNNLNLLKEIKTHSEKPNQITLGIIKFIYMKKCTQTKGKFIKKIKGLNLVSTQRLHQMNLKMNQDSGSI